MKTRWQTKRTNDPLWPSDSPVVVVVNAYEDGPDTLRGWAWGSPVFARAPEPRRKVSLHRDVLAPGGTAIFQQQYVDLPLDDDHPRLHVKEEGVYRVDLATGERTRVGFEPRHDPERMGPRPMAPAPGAQSVVILDGWSAVDEPPPASDGLNAAEAGRARLEYLQRVRENFRLRLSLATCDGAPPREIVTLDGVSAGDMLTSSCQWSPDARLLAFNFTARERGLMASDVVVFDTETWRIVARFEDGQLTGSASWGPDSDRLLLRSADESREWVQHLSGERQPITVLGGYGHSGTRPAYPLGIADNDHLITLRATRRRSTLMRTSLADGTNEGIVAWESDDGGHPVLAQMPPETWA